jgi:hypothetical protein
MIEGMLLACSIGNVLHREWLRLGLLHVRDGGRCGGGEAQLRHNTQEKMVAWAVALGWAQAPAAAQLVGSDSRIAGGRGGAVHQ